jgi:putative tryptophan/tyrosine transport system substrate-binding protein
MRKKVIGFALCAMLFALCPSAEAQQTGKIFRLGFLDGSTASGMAGLLETFRQEMGKLGWIEGKNITIEYRFAEQKPERLPELAADLVRLKVDLIVVTAGRPVLAAKGATTTIPIVMTNPADPIDEGIIASLARPGGNVTGLSSLAVELNTKRLEILKDAVPKLARVGLLRPPGDSITSGLQLKELRPAAQVLKLKLEEIETQPDPKGLASAFKNAKQKQVNAIMTITTPPFSPKESGSWSLPANTGCPLFTSRRSLSMRAALCPTGWTSMTCSARGRLRGQDLERRQTG